MSFPTQIPYIVDTKRFWGQTSFGCFIDRWMTVSLSNSKSKTKNQCWGKSEIHDFLFQIWCPSFQFPVNFQSWEDQLCLQLDLRKVLLNSIGNLLSHPPPSHRITPNPYICACREKKNPFLTIILVASCNGGSVKAPLCTKGNRRPKKATVTCYGCRHIVRFSSPVCWAPWESLFHGNAFRNFSCALSSWEDLNHVCNSMSNLKRSRLNARMIWDLYRFTRGINILQMDTVISDFTSARHFNRQYHAWCWTGKISMCPKIVCRKKFRMNNRFRHSICALDSLECLAQFNQETRGSAYSEWDWRDSIPVPGQKEIVCGPNLRHLLDDLTFLKYSNIFETPSLMPKVTWVSHLLPVMTPSASGCQVVCE